VAALALLIGAVLIVAAIRNSHAALLTALRTDVPGFAVWAAAIIALSAIGFVPSLKPVSRALLALVLVVIILRNYQTILSGFQSAWQGAESQAAGSGQAETKPGGSGFGLGDLGKMVQQFFGSPDLNATDNAGSGASING
jgi:hypothetical protein